MERKISKHFEKDWSPKNKYLRETLDVGFTLPIEMIFKLAYYVGSLPFRVERRNGRFVFETWFPQKILCYFITTWQAYSKIRLIHGSMYPFREESMDKPGNPRIYFYVFDRIIDFVWTLSGTYMYCFNSKKLLQLLNTLEKYSNRYYPRNPGIWRKRIWSRSFIKTVAVLLGIYEIMNWWILSDFRMGYEEVCRYVKETLNLPWNGNNIPCNKPGVMNFFEVGTLAFLSATEQITFQQYILIQLVPAITIWMMATDFKNTSFQHILNINFVRKEFRQIYRVSRKYSDTFGFIILFAMLAEVIYYSVNMNKIFINDAILGEKIFYMEDFTIVVLRSGLLSYSAHQISSVLIAALRYHKESKTHIPNKKTMTLLLHWRAHNSGAVHAKIFEVTFPSVFACVACLMLLFYVSITTPCVLPSSYQNCTIADNSAN